MKKIEAIVRPEKLNDIVSALMMEGISSGMTIYEVEGHGKQKGIVEIFRGREYKLDFLSKIKIEIIVKDKDLERVVNTILKNGYTGNIGDGKIFITDIQECIRIRTNERGEEAV